MLTHYSPTSPENTNSHKREAEANLYPKTAGLVIFVFNKIMAVSSKKLPVINKKLDDRKNQIYVCHFNNSLSPQTFNSPCIKMFFSL